MVQTLTGVMNSRVTIHGAGLAGCCVAWRLHRRGVPFALIDRGDASTASRVAAGLLNPITGKRLAVMPEWHSLLATAADFYRDVERHTSTSFFHACGMVRLLKDDHEADKFRKRSDAEFQSLIATVDPPLGEAFIDTHGGFTVPTAARLDVNAFLDATRQAFRQQFQVRSAHVSDFEGTVIHCTGLAAMQEMPELRHAFQPAKGDVLTVRVPGLAETRIVNRGVWLMPLGEELFRVGATYAWNDLDSIPTTSAREELLGRLKQFLKVPFEVVDHRAATRPILVDRQPMLGRIAENVFVLNGLGSKGALLAPHHAGKLANHVLDGTPMVPALDVQRFRTRGGL